MRHENIIFEGVNYDVENWKTKMQFSLELFVEKNNPIFHRQKSNYYNFCEYDDENLGLF